MESTEHENNDLLKALAYPFILHSTPHLSAREFIFSISLDALLCSPSTVLLLLKCGIQKGLLVFDSQKKQISTTFDYSKVRVLLYPDTIDKLVKLRCKDVTVCCEELSSLKNLYSLIASTNSSTIEASQPRNSTHRDMENNVSNLHKTPKSRLNLKDNNKKKRNKSKKAKRGTTSLEDYF